MTVKLKLDEPLYALYKEDTAEYVYLGGGNGVFGFKPYPKPTGMAPTPEKLKKKHENLLARITKLAEEGEQDPELFERAWQQVKHYQTREQHETIWRNNDIWQKERWSGELEIAKKFIIVKINVEKV